MDKQIQTEPPPFSFQKLIKQWEDQRMRPEHHGESVNVFYCWRVITILSAIVGYLVCQLGFPVSVVLLDHWWPAVPTYVLAISMFLLIVLGFFAGFMLSKGLDAILLSIELRISTPRQSA